MGPWVPPEHLSSGGDVVMSTWGSLESSVTTPWPDALSDPSPVGPQFHYGSFHSGPVPLGRASGNLSSNPQER